MEEEAGQEPHAFIDLGLAVDHATLTAPFFQLTLFEDQSLEKSISISSLKMLPLEATYFTQNGSQVTRVSTSEVKLSNGGEEVIFTVPDDEPPVDGIFVVEGQKPLLLEADGYSAEKVVEDLTGQRLFEGIPFYDSAPVSPRPKGSLTQYLGLSKRKPKGVSAGHILFSLRSLPLDKMYCFSFADGRPAMCSITRLSNRFYKINGCKYSSAEVQQVLDDDSGIVDYVFPNLSPRKSAEGARHTKLEDQKQQQQQEEKQLQKHDKEDDADDDDEDDDDDNDGDEEDDKMECENGEPGKEDLREEHHTRMMIQFEEKLQNAIKLRQQEKEQKMAKMMAKYQKTFSEDDLGHEKEGNGIEPQRDGELEEKRDAVNCGTSVNHL